MTTSSSKALRSCSTLLVILFAGGLTAPAEAQLGLPGFVEEEKLTAHDAEADDQFGSSVSISGDMALVGAPNDDFTTGSAYVFVRSGVSWTEEAKLRSSDIEFNDFFGASVSISGDRALVGATGQGSFSGSAYVFVRNGSTWTEEAKLTASDGKDGDQFGSSVALSGDRAIVGAWLDDGNGNGQQSGSAYVFVRNGTTWIEEAHVIASDGQPNDVFGRSVAISGDTALVAGDPIYKEGTAYVFVRNGASWTEEAKLTASDGAPGFASSIAVSGDRALVGAPDDANDEGSAFVFVRGGTNWIEEAKLTASGGAWDDHFGASVSLSGDVALVGANTEAHAPVGEAGAAYLCVRSGVSWAQVAKLIASDGQYKQGFGVSVSLSGGTALVGADEDYGNGPGSAYVFAPPPPSSYCAAGTSASGCQALISGTGTASASAPSGFILSASGVEGAKDGIFFWGATGQQATPWGNGTSFQCVAPPVTRGGQLTGTGTNGACDGAFVQDLNATWCSTCPYAQKNPGFGALLHAQLWYRDPLNTSNQTTSLSDAIEFGVGP